MGGQITFCARFSDDTIVSIDTSTSFCSWFLQSPDCINEEIIIETLKLNGRFPKTRRTPICKHYPTENDPLAPSEYGIVFIDYQKKEIHSFNDYAPTLTLNSFQLRDQYTAMYLREDLDEFNWYEEDGSVNRIKVWEKPITRFHATHFLHLSMKYNPKIHFKDKLISNKNQDLHSVLATIYGSEIDTSIDDWKELIEIENNRYYLNNDQGISDVKISYDGWKVEDNLQTKQNITNLYVNISNSIILSDKEHSIWRDVIYR